MKKLQAALRDRSAKAWVEAKRAYKVGSYFKGCRHCGDTEVLELESGREVLRYLSGYQVYRSYSPSAVGWTYWCYECGAKDLACWEDAADIGRDAIVGSRDAVRASKAYFRKQLARNDAPQSEAAVRVGRKVEDEIRELAAEVERL